MFENQSTQINFATYNFEKFDENVRFVTSMHEDERCQDHKCYSTRYSTIESLLDANVREYFSSQMHVINSALYDSRVTTIKFLISTRHLTRLYESYSIFEFTNNIEQSTSFNS